MSQARDQSAVIDVLTALFDVVEVGALPPWLVAKAAGVEVSVADAVTVGDHLAVRRRQDGWFVVDRALRPADAGQGPDVDILRRAAEGVRDLLFEVTEPLRERGHAERSVDARRWLRDHRECVLGVAGAANAVGLPSSAAPITALLREVADVAGFDPEFIRALADTGARSAIAERAPRTLGAVLRSAWVWFERRGELAAAEEYASREWDLWWRAGETAEAVRLLWWRAEMSRRRGRGDLELRCYERLESLHDNVMADQRAALVRIWTATASALLAYGRAELAVDFARRAENAVRVLPDFPPTEQALVFEWSGRALWASDAVGPARRRFSEALALLVDVDDDAADRTRRLLTHDQAHALPLPVPDRYPAPVPPPSFPS